MENYSYFINIENIYKKDYNDVEISNITYNITQYLTEILGARKHWYWSRSITRYNTSVSGQFWSTGLWITTNLDFDEIMIILKLRFGI